MTAVGVSSVLTSRKGKKLVPGSTKKFQEHVALGEITFTPNNHIDPNTRRLLRDLWFLNF